MELCSCDAYSSRKYHELYTGKLRVTELNTWPRTGESGMTIMYVYEKRTKQLKLTKKSNLCTRWGFQTESNLAIVYKSMLDLRICTLKYITSGRKIRMAFPCATEIKIFSRSSSNISSHYLALENKVKVPPFWNIKIKGKADTVWASGSIAMHKSISPAYTSISHKLPRQKN